MRKKLIITLIILVFIYLLPSIYFNIYYDYIDIYAREVGISVHGKKYKNVLKKIGEPQSIIISQIDGSELFRAEAIYDDMIITFISYDGKTINEMADIKTIKITSNKYKFKGGVHVGSDRSIVEKVYSKIKNSNGNVYYDNCTWIAFEYVNDKVSSISLYRTLT